MKLVIKVIRGIVHDEDRKLDITTVKFIRSETENHWLIAIHQQRLLEAVRTSNALRLSRHANIVPVYGFVTNMGNFPSPVTPYYENGDALHYLAKMPNANKYQIVGSYSVRPEESYSARTLPS